MADDRWGKLKRLIKAAGAKLTEIEALPVDQVTAEMHADVDRMTAEAAKLREGIDRDRSVAQLNAIAGMRADLSDAGSYIQAQGLVPLVNPNQPSEVDEYAKIHAKAKDLFDGKISAASFEVPMVAAAVQRMLIKAGYTGSDLVRAAQSGRLASLLPPPAKGFDDQGNMVTAALSTSVLNPTTFSTTFYDYLESVAGLRAAGAEVTPMDRGNTVTFYTNTSHNTTTGATGEGSAAGENEDTYGSYSVETKMYTGLAYVSRQLIEDAGPAALMSIIDNDVSRVVARKSETAYHTAALITTGNANTRYDRTAKAASDSAAGDPKITRSMVLSSIFGLDEGYITSPGMRVLGRGQTYQQMLGITWGTNFPQSIYQPNAVAGAPRLVEGYPFLFDAFLPAIVAASNGGADQEALLVGDINRAFHIVDVGGVRVDMSREYKFAEQQVTVLASLRTGGAIKDPKGARLAMSDGDSA